MLQGDVFHFGLSVEKHRVALVESAAPGVLPTEPDWSSTLYETGESESLRHAVVDGPSTGAHFGALFKQLLHFGMNMEVCGIGCKTLSEMKQFFCRDGCFDLVLWLVAPALIIVPIIR